MYSKSFPTLTRKYSLLIALAIFIISAWVVFGLSFLITAPAPVPAVDLNPAPAAPPSPGFLVALQPLGRGAEFVPGSFGRREIPDSLPRDIVRDEAEMIGQVARTDLVQGQLIIRGMLADPCELSRSCSPCSQAPPIEFVCYQRSQGHLYGLDNQTRDEIWRFAAAKVVIPTLVIGDDTVYFWSEDGYLRAVETKTGQIKWRFQGFETPEIVNSARPVIGEGTLFFWHNRERSLYALDAQTGQEKWRFSAAGLATYPTVTDGIVSFASSDGNRHGLDVETGQEQWRGKQ